MGWHINCIADCQFFIIQFKYILYDNLIVSIQNPKLLLHKRSLRPQ